MNKKYKVAKISEKVNLDKDKIECIAYKPVEKLVVNSIIGLCCECKYSIYRYECFTRRY